MASSQQTTPSVMSRVRMFEEKTSKRSTTTDKTKGGDFRINSASRNLVRNDANIPSRNSTTATPLTAPGTGPTRRSMREDPPLQNRQINAINREEVRSDASATFKHYTRNHREEVPPPAKTSESPTSSRNNTTIPKELLNKLSSEDLSLGEDSSGLKENKYTQSVDTIEDIPVNHAGTQQSRLLQVHQIPERTNNTQIPSASQSETEAQHDPHQAKVSLGAQAAVGRDSHGVGPESSLDRSQISSADLNKVTKRVQGGYRGHQIDRMGSTESGRSVGSASSTNRSHLSSADLDRLSKRVLGVYRGQQEIGRTESTGSGQSAGSQSTAKGSQLSSANMCKVMKRAQEGQRGQEIGRTESVGSGSSSQRSQLSSEYLRAIAKRALETQHEGDTVRTKGTGSGSSSQRSQLSADDLTRIAGRALDAAKEEAAKQNEQEKISTHSAGSARKTVSRVSATTAYRKRLMKNATPAYQHKADASPSTAPAPKGVGAEVAATPKEDKSVSISGSEREQKARKPSPVRPSVGRRRLMALRERTQSPAMRKYTKGLNQSKQKRAGNVASEQPADKLSEELADKLSEQSTIKPDVANTRDPPETDGSKEQSNEESCSRTQVAVDNQKSRGNESELNKKQAEIPNDHFQETGSTNDESSQNIFSVATDPDPILNGIVLDDKPSVDSDFQAQATVSEDASSAFEKLVPNLQANEEWNEPGPIDQWNSSPDPSLTRPIPFQPINPQPRSIGAHKMANINVNHFRPSQEYYQRQQEDFAGSRNVDSALTSRENVKNSSEDPPQFDSFSEHFDNNEFSNTNNPLDSSADSSSHNVDWEVVGQNQSNAFGDPELDPTNASDSDSFSDASFGVDNITKEFQDAIESEKDAATPAAGANVSEALESAMKLDLIVTETWTPIAKHAIFAGGAIVPTLSSQSSSAFGVQSSDLLEDSSPQSIDLAPHQQLLSRTENSAVRVYSPTGSASLKIISESLANSPAHTLADQGGPETYSSLASLQNQATSLTGTSHRQPYLMHIEQKQNSHPPVETPVVHGSKIASHQSVHQNSSGQDIENWHHFGSSDSWSVATDEFQGLDQVASPTNPVGASPQGTVDPSIPVSKNNEHGLSHSMSDYGSDLDASAGQSTLLGQSLVKSRSENDRTMSSFDNDQSTLLGQFHVSSRSEDETNQNSAAAGENDLSTLLGQFHVESPDRGAHAQPENVDSNSVAYPSDAGSETRSQISNAASRISGSDALQWWQSNYASSQGEDVNSVVQQALSRHQTSPINVDEDDDDEDVFSGIEDESSPKRGGSTNDEAKRSSYCQDSLGRTEQGSFNEIEKNRAMIQPGGTDHVSTLSDADAKDKKHEMAFNEIIPLQTIIGKEGSVSTLTTAVKTPAEHKAFDDEDVASGEEQTPIRHTVVTEQSVTSDITTSIVSKELPQVSTSQSDDVLADWATSSGNESKDKEVAEVAAPLEKVEENRSEEDDSDIDDDESKSRSVADFLPKGIPSGVQESEEARRYKAAASGPEASNPWEKSLLTNDSTLTGEATLSNASNLPMSSTGTLQAAKNELMNEGVRERERSRRPDDQQQKSIFMNIGCGILDTFTGNVCKPLGFGDNEGQPDDATSFGGSALSQSYSESLASVRQLDLSEKEKKVWEDWERRDTQTNADSQPDTNGNSSRLEKLHERQRQAQHLERRAHAHEKLLLFAYTALSVPPPPPDAEKGEKTLEAAVGSKMFSTISIASGEDAAKNPSETHKNKKRTQRFANAGKLSSDVPTEMGSGTGKPPSMPVNQKRFLENFVSPMRSKGMEVLKLNRDNKWQTRYLTVSKEVAVANVNGEKVPCPLGILWLKKFNQRSTEHSIVTIDKQGRGGVLVKQLVHVAATAKSDPQTPLTKKQLSGKFKDSVLVNLRAKDGETSRHVSLRCPTKQEAHLLCTSIRIILELITRNPTIEGPGRGSVLAVANQIDPKKQTSLRDANADPARNAKQSDLWEV